ncbi:MAG TPA: 2,4'-dihydroxyacetophenone dioxygenase family protein [Steroidobacteraceae bacterium]
MAQARQAGQVQTVIHDTKPDHWQFFDPATLPWTPWAMPQTHFKLFHVNEGTGSFTFLLKVEPGATAIIHKHLGEAEAYILEGEFGYGAERGKAGWYAYEAGGAIHTPDAPQGLLLFAIAHGPIMGYNPDGTIAGVIDVEWMYEAARKNGAAGHIKRHVRFTAA